LRGNPRPVVNGSRDRGSVLVEFALVSLVLWLLFAIAIDFGRLMFSAQALQDAARTAARELAVIPLPANVVPAAAGDPGGFDAALNYLDPVTGMFPVRDRIFNPGCLVINLDNFTDAGGVVDQVALQQFRDAMPVVNRALYPLMNIDLSGGRDLLRYPGALLADTTGTVPPCGTQPSTGFVVGIPLVTGHNPETIRWLPVVEEIRSGDWTTGPFNLTDPGSNPNLPRGVVALRFNYPYEAAAISSFQPNPDGPAEPTIGHPNVADEGSVVQENQAPGDTLADEGEVGPYTGPYGLGRQLAFASTVRPYSRVLSGQAISRREVFLP
jgi:hypothetical protein